MLTGTMQLVSHKNLTSKRTWDVLNNKPLAEVNYINNDVLMRTNRTTID